MKLSLIVACGPDGEIGCRGKLPWPKLRPDRQWFADKTQRRPVIMGRRTWESLPGRPLLGRHNIVLTRDLAGMEAAIRDLDRSMRCHVDAVDSVPAAQALAELHAEQARPAHAPFDWQPEAFVIGGGQVYREFLPLANRVYLTKVAPIGGGGFPEADAWFPHPLPTGEWTERPAHDRWFAAGDCRVGFYVYDRVMRPSRRA